MHPAAGMWRGNHGALLSESVTTDRLVSGLDRAHFPLRVRAPGAWPVSHNRTAPKKGTRALMPQSCSLRQSGPASTSTAKELLAAIGREAVSRRPSHPFATRTHVGGCSRPVVPREVGDTPHTASRSSRRWARRLPVDTQVWASVVVVPDGQDLSCSAGAAGSAGPCRERPAHAPSRATLAPSWPAATAQAPPGPLAAGRVRSWRVVAPRTASRWVGSRGRPSSRPPPGRSRHALPPLHHRARTSRMATTGTRHLVVEADQP